METPKKPWNFCETPEEKCTMNYCDDNGCQNRKRILTSEEIPDNTAIIKKLEAEKKEILSILKGLVSDVGNLIGEHDIEWQQAGYFESAKEVIQKQKEIKEYLDT